MVSNKLIDDRLVGDLEAIVSRNNCPVVVEHDAPHERLLEGLKAFRGNRQEARILRWRGVRLRYSSTLVADAGGKFVSKHLEGPIVVDLPSELTDARLAGVDAQDVADRLDNCKSVDETEDVCESSASAVVDAHAPQALWKDPLDRPPGRVRRASDQRKQHRFVGTMVKPGMPAMREIAKIGRLNRTERGFP